ncbi:TadE family protein [Nocardiopsis sp. NPDC058631]|uniref:TadE family protein n=1 Tax=Nocardiopsis sp. NPDC058631 TaxID=3346566 RepID=UPI00364E3336
MKRLIGPADRGGADTLFVIPLMFTMLLGILQYGMWTHAHHRAQAVATQALAAGRAHEGSAREGQERGQAMVEDLGGTILHDVRVRVERRDGTTRATVTGTTVSLVPGWQPPVEATLSGPTEHVPEALP